MTTTTNTCLAPALSGQAPGLTAPASVTRACYGVAKCLLASAIAVGLLAGEDTTTKHAQPVAVTPPLATDPPAPAFVLRLERDPFR